MCFSSHSAFRCTLPPEACPPSAALSLSAQAQPATLSACEKGGGDRDAAALYQYLYEGGRERCVYILYLFVCCHAKLHLKSQESNC